MLLNGEHLEKFIWIFLFGFYRWFIAFTASPRPCVEILQAEGLTQRRKTQGKTEERLFA